MKGIKTISILLGAIIVSVGAQSQIWMGKSEIGFTLGGMTYIGDLNGQSLMGEPNIGLGGLFRYQFNERWSIRADVDYGRLEGGNPDIIERRNLSFRSHLLEGTLRAEFNFFPFSMREDHFSWTPFIFGGLGVFHFNPKAYYTNPMSGEKGWYALQPLGTEGQGTILSEGRTPYSLIQVCMPFGVGVKWHPSKSLTLSAEYGWRKTWTDYIDDVSTVYVDNDMLSSLQGDLSAALADRSSEVVNGYVNAAGIKRGDDSLDDWYAYFNISMTVKLDLIFAKMLKKKCNNK